MDMGARLKQARLAAGLSQRQLCGDVITRNMLSRIENGSARPSMDTLQYLAARLERPMAWFLEEEIPCGPEERKLRRTLELLEQARQAAAAEKQLLAQSILEELEIREDDLCAPELRRSQLLLLAEVCPRKRRDFCRQLPSLDGELMLRALDALEGQELPRAAALLDAMECRNAPQWQYLRGQVYLAQGEHRAAAERFHLAEGDMPKETAPLLERCYRELGDFKQAYEYACRQR